MGLKKRNKVSAEFSMSSLTDIIFLLLIFFMLTSNLVSPNALNLKLPGDGKIQKISSANPPDIRIKRSGSFYIDNKKISAGNIPEALRRLKSANGNKKLDITISPDEGTPVQHVVTIMNIAMDQKVNAILATSVD